MALLRWILVVRSYYAYEHCVTRGGSVTLTPLDKIDPADRKRRTLIEWRLTAATGGNEAVGPVVRREGIEVIVPWHPTDP